jgi:hypothetical protein
VARAARRGASTTREDNRDALEEAGDELAEEAVRGLQEEACTLLIIVTLLLHIAIAMLWRSVSCQARDVRVKQFGVRGEEAAAQPVE